MIVTSDIVMAFAMARRLGVVLALAAVVLLAAAGAAPAQSKHRAPNANGPKPKPNPISVKCSESPRVNPYCSNQRMDCPANCPQSCYADCKSCKPVCGEHFVS